VLSSVPLDWICPSCRRRLDPSVRDLCCRSCAVRFPVEDGIADFLAGRYYDRFDPAAALSEDQRLGLCLEECGAAGRIDNYYRPRLERLRAEGPVVRRLRVLDCGCGNGIGVDRLNESGFEAWGTDASALRKHQWQERRLRERFFVADALALPAPTGFFDVVIASGVLEHIGVREQRNPRYSVETLPDRDALRNRFLSELLRVTNRDGRIWLDFPNGAFQIDFWHGDRPGDARWHSRAEGFLPSLKDVRKSLASIDDGAVVRALSPHGRLAFHQVGLHLYGRALRIPARIFLRLTATWPLRFLSGTGLNPYMVLEITRRG
jgi:SAM-dependent methyltransferase